MTILGLDSRWLYLGVVVLVVAERLVEVAVTRRNAARLVARGGFEVGQGHYLPMALLHAALLAAAPAEVWLLDRPLVPALAAAMLVVLAATMALRYWAVVSLGDRWTTRIFVVPGEPPVTRGPYRWLRHPNYVAVIAEVAALPLIHTAWWTAAVCSAANALLLRTRIRTEEAALEEHSEYRDTVGQLPRFVPGRATGC